MRQPKKFQEPGLRMEQVARLARANTKDIENYHRRGYLSTPYKGSVQGRPRSYSRVNAIELVLFRAMIRLGLSPLRATAHLPGLVRAAFEEWELAAIVDEEVKRVSLTDLASSIGTVATFVMIGAAVRLVDTAYPNPLQCAA